MNNPNPTTDAVMSLGRLALLFGRTNRITRHEDGVTPESDTDHTVMLGLVACALAPHIRADLDVGLVAQYALVHDLVEAYAGDTNTLRALDDAGRADKVDREKAAYQRIAGEFADSLPWVPDTIDEYEHLATPEARYVKALDKLLPKITHILNNVATVHQQGMSFDELEARYTTQIGELRVYAVDFPALFDLRAELVARVLRQFQLNPNPTANDTWQQHEPQWVPTQDDGGNRTHVVGTCSCGETFTDQEDSVSNFGGHITALGAPDYMQTYWQFWARYTEAPTGALSRDAVARELFDYGVVMQEASKVYSELAGLSKPNTAAHHIIDGAEQRFNEIHADNILDELLDQMDSDAARQAVIDYANSLHETAYEEHLGRIELRAQYAAQHAEQPAKRAELVARVLRRFHLIRN